jgi:hypothetical protein
MRLILAQTAKTFVCVSLLFGLLVGVSFLVVPAEPASDILDTRIAEASIYSTQTKYLSFTRGALVAPRPRVLVMGASNANVGLRPFQIQTGVPCASVSNLAIGNANVTEIGQIVDLVHDVQSPATRSQNTFVFGTWFGLFSDGRDRWPNSSRDPPETDLEAELYRYGFYHRAADKPQPRLPAAWLPLQGVLIRPFIATEVVARQLTDRLRGYFFVRHQKRTDAEREAVHFGEEDRREATTYWYNMMGRKDNISAEEFTNFENLINRLLDAHEKVVVVDLPLPKWNQEISVYDSKYRQRLPGLIKTFAGREGFAFSDLSGLSIDDDDYSDEVHPKPSLAKLWAERLGKTVKSIACSVENSALAEQAGKKQ